MTLIAEDIVVAAMASSTKNQPNRIATNATELLDVVRRAVQGIFALTARVNPEYYGEREDVAFNVDHWPAPADAELIWLIEDPALQEVIVVPSTDRRADEARPAVFRLGRKFYTAGNTLDPVGGLLRFYFSSRPATLAAIGDPIDARFPDQFKSLLVCETAIYLSLKDGRHDEVPGLRESRNEWLKLYVAHVEHEVVNEVRRFGHTRSFHLPSLMPLLAGGGA
jgi:hypothetical protein